MRKKSVILGFLFTLSVGLAVSGVGQERKSSGESGFQPGARYYLGSLKGGGAEELLMNVNVWGFVQKPGQYLVPAETDLVSLISFAGGPLQDASLGRVQLVRSGRNNREQAVIDVDLDAYLKKGDPDLLPVLRPGDTVVVRAGRMYGVRRVLEWVWRVAVVIQAYALTTYYLTRG